jgi:hypothetical protein
MEQTGLTSLSCWVSFESFTVPKVDFTWAQAESVHLLTAQAV